MHPFTATIRHAVQRGILTGHQCICGQFQPDFVMHGVSNEFRTECCGSVYFYQLSTSKPTGFSTLSLVEDNFTKREVSKLP